MDLAKFKTSTSKYLRKPVVAVVVVPILIGLAFYAGQWYQGQLDQQQTNLRFNHIDCSQAAFFANYYNSKGENATVINNQDGSCSLHFTVGLTVTMSQSVCVQVVVSRANGSVTTEGDCSISTTASTTTT